MAASFSDQSFLSQDAVFLTRVKEALAQTCINVVGEAITLANLQIHISRARLATQILLNISGGTPNWPQIFAVSVATDAAVSGAASTQAGGPLTSANTPAAAAAVTDAQISNAISGQFNSFLTLV